MVVPVFHSHYSGNQKQSNNTGCRSSNGFAHIFFKCFNNCQSANTNPHGKSIEGTGIGIIPLPGLQGILVEISHNGKAGHEKEQENNPQSLFALCSFAVLVENTKQSQYQRQKIIGVSCLIVGKTVGEAILTS